MALDGAFLYTVKDELNILIGSRIDKIYQPSREEIVISLRSKGGNMRLLFSAAANSARVNITNIQPDNPNTPPMFCMLMRKHFGGGKLVDIRQDGLERILFFDFECMNELGDMVKLTLAAEIMGRHSNLIIINENGLVLDSIKRVDTEMSRERPILPGIRYTAPPRTDRLSFLEATPETIRNKLKEGKSSDLSKTILSTFEGVSPLLAREWAFYAARGKEILSGECDDEIYDRLIFAVSRSREALLSGGRQFTVVSEKDGRLKDFSFIRIAQYGGFMVTREFPSACEVLDYFYAERDRSARLKQRGNDMLKLLANTSDRIQKRLNNQKEELSLCAEKEIFKLKGDLISANIYKLQKGQKTALLENYYDEALPLMEIDLDEKLSPSQNAQKYYSEYRKKSTAEKKLAEQIRLGTEELEYIDSVFDALTRVNNEDEITLLRIELAEQGYIKLYKQKGKNPRLLPPHEFVSSDGFKILVGRNNKQNDILTLKTADKSDIWLHTHNIPGSHTIIVTNGAEPPDSTIAEAAQLAALNSRAKDSSQVPVDYCLVKYVKKPVGAKPGMVIFTHNKTIFVTPKNEQV